MIGETHIDLEARLLSSARPLCGLPQIYFAEGPDKWRDVKKPKDLLSDYCTAHELDPPNYTTSGYVDTVMDADGECVAPHLRPAHSFLSLRLIRGRQLTVVSLCAELSVDTTMKGVFNLQGVLRMAASLGGTVPETECGAHATAVVGSTSHHRSLSHCMDRDPKSSHLSFGTRR